MKEDRILEEAIKLATSLGSIRAAILQRELKLGYSRAHRVMQQIEERGLLIDGNKGEYWYDRTVM